MTDDTDSHSQLPRATAGDAAHSAIRAAAGLIPFAGAPIGELVGWIVKPPLERRRDEWMASVESRLRNLHERLQIDLDRVREDETFTDIFLQATQAAMRTSSTRKRHALRNAVLNSARLLSADELQQSVFLGLLDNFTPVHIQLLELFGGPHNWYRTLGPRPSPQQLIGHAFPQADWDISVCQHICNRMADDGVIDHFSSMLSVPDDPSEVVSLSRLGRALLEFISDPVSDSSRRSK